MTEHGNDLSQSLSSQVTGASVESETKPHAPSSGLFAIDTKIWQARADDLEPKKVTRELQNARIYKARDLYFFSHVQQSSIYKIYRK